MRRKLLFLLTIFVTLLSAVPLKTVYGKGATFPDLPPDKIKIFNISAIDVDVAINRWGDHVPSAKMYVLDENISAVRARAALPLTPDANGVARASIGLHDLSDLIQPLVIRANIGDSVVINFTNRLAAGRAGLTIHGLPMDPDTSFGAAVGINADTLVDVDQSTTYKYLVPNMANAEGSYVFNCLGDPRTHQALGLFGVLNIEPAGSTYLSPVTGLSIRSGWEAMIVDPLGKDFREDTIIYHEWGDETFQGIVSATGQALPVNDSLGTYRPGSRALNYRSEPFSRRQEFLAATVGFEDEALSYGSYTFGDPPYFQRGYVGDPTKRRLAHAGSERFHSEHLHGGSIRWPFDPTTVADGARLPDGSPSPDAGRWGQGFNKHPQPQFISQRLDVQEIGPLETYTEMMEGAAGGLQAGAGEFLWHCHFGEHYVGGMWSFWRAYDTLQGDQSLAGEPALAELPDRRGLIPTAVTSDALIGKPLPSGKLLTAGPTDATHKNIDEWFRTVLPPQGNPGLAANWDATVWDWTVQTVNGLPRYMGEAETTSRTW